MSTKINILIAEDEVNIALALKTIVKKVLLDASITVVNNGKDAMDSIIASNYDLIISDWNMPQMTGFELLTALRDNSNNSEIPFLMLTARGDKTSVLSAVQGGVTAYISKPFEKKYIIKKIKELLKDNITDNNINDPDKKIASSPSNLNKSNSISYNNKKSDSQSSTEQITIESLSAKLHNGEIDFPVFPVIGLKALELTKNDNVTTKQLSKLIKQDTSLSSKILAIANSSYYGCDHQFDIIEDALLLIGIENTSNIILSTSNKSLYKKYHGVIGKRLNTLLEHSFTTAACAKVLSNKLCLDNAEKIFAMGLLHDVGKLALLTVLGSLSKNTNNKEHEVDTLLDELHVEFGQSLVTNWNMSDEFIQAVANHHNINNMKNMDTSTQVIALADLLVRRIGKSLTKYDYNDPAENKMKQLLSISDDMIIEILQETKEQVNALKV